MDEKQSYNVNEPWMQVCERITNKVIKYLKIQKVSDKEKLLLDLKKTFAYSWEINKGHFRLNGESNFEHIVKSLDNLLVVKPDIETIELCLLHDAVSVSKVSLEIIRKNFGETIALLISKYEKLRKIQLRSDSEEEINTLRQMLLVLADDVRVILVKLASKLHGLESINGLARPKQIINAKEVLDVYAPMASRLGVYALKIRLEDAAFKILRPSAYAEIEGELKTLMQENSDIIEKSTVKLQEILRAHKLHADIKGRIKSVYSIAKKIKDKHAEHVAELHDIFALRVLVESKEDCYRLFGLIHEEYPPIPGKIKDYIALPKSNHYQSLHTTITDIYDSNPHRPVEVQIRTYAMDEIAEYGIASHNTYKEGVKKVSKTEEWQKKLAGLNKYYSKKGRFNEEGQDLSRLIDKVFILTPKGEVKAMRKGCTPLDFAYAIHTDIGHRCVAAKVNNKVVPLSHTLQTGDLVEIITRKDHEPSATSLMYLKSQTSKTKLKAYLEAKMRDEYIRKGKTLLDQELKILKKPQLDSKLTLLGEQKLPEKESILIQIGRGALKPFMIISKMFPGIIHPREQLKEKKPEVKKVIVDKLKIDGQTDVTYEFAKCCFPKGRSKVLDRGGIVGYLTLGTGVKIHKKTCKHLNSKDKDRFVTIS